MQAEPGQNDHVREARLQHIGAGARLCRRNMTAVGVQENSAQETAYRAKRQRTITAVQECWLEEGAVVPVLRRLTAELGPYEDPAETGAFAVVTHMSEAFCIRLVFAAKFTRWHAIGGDLSDEETEKRFEGFITCPQRPGPDGRTRPCETGQ
ncbi:hypothetical protein [Streptomyces sp. NPDC059949]|uniref:hypothetical protein n=1 Tax=Streptomyces sp. NPDC059949 TaxID=3347013 RepID=UPI003660E974